MCVDAGVSSGTGQVLVLSVRDVQVRLGISVLLGESEIDDVDLISSLSDSHQEIVGLDISVNEVSRVNVFDSGDLSSRSNLATRREPQSGCEDVRVDRRGGGRS